MDSKLGAWRDRTNLFISYRQSYTHHPAKRTRLTAPSGYRDDVDSERAGLMSNQDAGNDAVIEMDLLPPRWLDIQDEINTILSEVGTKMKKLDQLHAKHVLPGFDDESVKAQEEREIEGLTQEITRAFTTCQARIRKISTYLRDQQTQPNGAPLTQAEAKMATNLQTSLAARVGDVSIAFRKKQSAYLKKLRQLGGMTMPLDNPNNNNNNSRTATPSLTPATANPYTDPAMQDSETDRLGAQSTLLQTAQVRRRTTSAMDSTITQREREIEKIAQGVIDLSNIFQELNTMVIDQGSLLDRIDYNVERTHEHVQGAERELKVATGYQKRTTKRKVMLLLVLVVVGLFILVLVKPKGGGGGRPAETVPQPPKPVQPPPPEEGVEMGGAGGMLTRRRGDAVGGDSGALRSGAGRQRWKWRQRRLRREEDGRGEGDSLLLS
ncbi:t-SNARE [Hortaea werneckii]|uniref:t-SNARE coiled-coil homology domain-containing protein n=2 Tax=Hortaea werneckii TaxID=91943 RepID=A0A3M7HKQ8_HORWE|nr:t-SNARE [Hortaea werneckii]KAI6873954.1 t-SNARE [Hortaea werneckii]KAI7558008.1 t-SNARE [Hortaea werneckii]KAI7618720.1 t-SNARE [Hortaea werneckii]KAI7628245.1 t-SNARE [Hortaea werneckii]